MKDQQGEQHDSPAGRRSAGARSLRIDGLQHRGRLLLLQHDGHGRHGLLQHDELHDSVEFRQTRGDDDVVDLDLRQLGSQVLPFAQHQHKLRRNNDDGSQG